MFWDACMDEQDENNMLQPHSAGWRHKNETPNFNHEEARHEKNCLSVGIATNNWRIYYQERISRMHLAMKSKCWCLLLWIRQLKLSSSRRRWENWLRRRHHRRDKRTVCDWYVTRSWTHLNEHVLLWCLHRRNCRIDATNSKWVTADGSATYCCTTECSRRNTGTCQMEI